MLVELSPEQMLTCHEEAVGRAEHYVQGRRKNMKDGLTAEQVISYNVDGCMGELAVAVATGLEWTGVFGPDRHDVGDRIEVRSTRYQGGKLIVKELEADRCSPATPYVLAIIQGSSVRVAGWRDLDYVVEYGAAYEQKGLVFLAVPQTDLLPIRGLR